MKKLAPYRTDASIDKLPLWEGNAICKDCIHFNPKEDGEHPTCRANIEETFSHVTGLTLRCERLCWSSNLDGKCELFAPLGYRIIHDLEDDEFYKLPFWHRFRFYCFGVWPTKELSYPEK